jgi:hypothetical protein
MPNQQLISYIQEQLRRGYDIDSIRNYLLRYGYNEALIDDAINHVYVPRKKKPNKIILAIIGIMIITLGITLGIMLSSEPETKEVTLSVTSEMLSKQIIPGGYIYIRTDIVKSAGQAYVEYMIQQPDGKIIERAEEDTTSTKLTQQFKLPTHMPTGTYKVTTDVMQGEMTDSSSFTFVIKSDDQLPAEINRTEDDVPSDIGTCPMSCDDNDSCTADYCSEATGYLCMHDKITPCCGNAMCETGETDSTCPEDCKKMAEDEFETLTIWEKVDAIKEMAKTSHIKAKEQCDLIAVVSHRDQCYYNIAEASAVIDHCESIIDEKIKDKCLTKIAEATDSSGVCSSVSTESRRDNCYMNFVQAGDYSVCDKLVNKYYKESCDALSTMANVPDYRNYQIPG